MELAVKRMSALGNGFNILQAGSKKLVQSVPLELNTDHMTVMSLAQERCYVTKEMLREAFSWPQDRIAAALVRALQHGCATATAADQCSTYCLLTASCGWTARQSLLNIGFRLYSKPAVPRASWRPSRQQIPSPAAFRGGHRHLWRTCSPVLCGALP